MQLEEYEEKVRVVRATSLAGREARRKRRSTTGPRFLSARQAGPARATQARLSYPGHQPERALPVQLYPSMLQLYLTSPKRVTLKIQRSRSKRCLELTASLRLRMTKRFLISRSLD